MKSIIILCGGRGRRMGQDKGLVILKDKPLILHVLDTVENIADEIILVLRERNQVEKYQKLLNDKYKSLKIVTDVIMDQGPLVGILTGLSNINSEYALVLPCDSPFIDKSFVLKMFELAEYEKFDAIVPIWDDGHIEPLHSVYKKITIKTIRKLLLENVKDVKSLINRLNVEYVDVETVDKTTQSFQNLNTVNDVGKI